MNFLRKICLFVLPAAFVCLTAAGAPFVETQESLLSLERELREEVEHLCGESQKGRGFGQKEKNICTAYLESRFGKAGLRPLGDGFVHTFLCRGVPGRNVVGIREGKSAGKYVLVTTYYDGPGEFMGKVYPGADSNASGVAALLYLAETLNSEGASVIFICFDARNQSMAGSQAFWDELSGGKLVTPSGRVVRPSQIRIMSNMDIMGSTLSPVHPRWPNFVIAMSSESEFYNIRLSNSKHLLGLRVEPDYYGSRKFTEVFFRKVGDQKVFLSHGVPCVVWTSGITFNTNKPEDLPDTLDYPIFAKRTFLIRCWLEEWVLS
ncbi:MAG: M28 family peptidase [Bacteroidales bacterium]|nr:M28 family peptidase [Bacteroidales bacterium]